MVESFATNIHGYQQYTADMNIWIEDSLNNRANLRRAFRDADMGDYFMMETMQFIAGCTDF